MSNNIYDILKKIENLESPKQALAESKAMNTVKELHNESKKEKQTNKGTIAEAVAQVEQQLNEKYMGFKKKVVEAEVEESGLQAYLGKKKYGKEGMAALQQAGREGASKEKMAKIRAQHDKMDEATRAFMQRSPGAQMIRYEKDSPASGAQQHRDDTAKAVKSLRASGQKFKDYDEKKVGNATVSRYDHFNEADVVEGNQLPAPPDEVHLPKKGSKHGPVDVYKKPKNEDMLSGKDKEFAALAEPKDKITYADKIAGAKKDKKTEGNKFSGNLMKARAQGLDKADLDGDGDMEKVTKGASTMREGWEEMQKYLEKKKGPQSKGGEGKKAGTRYGGSAQKDDDEETDGEGKPVEKKKGRPKGTGGGAKFSFKKPKD